MNDERFDSWSRRLARGGSRRGLLRAAAGALAAVAGLGAGARPRAARAQDNDLPPILHVMFGSETDAPVVVDTSYTPDDDPTLRNPERGMYFGSTPNTPEEFHTIVPKWLWLAPACGVNLTWNGYNQPGTSSVLNTYAAQLEAARTGGYKVLFRPRYDKEPGGIVSDLCMINGVKVFHADTMVRQKNHIDAVAAMLGDYKDVIAFIQAGYLGNWGEWNWARYEKENAPFLDSYTTRSEIIDHVLSKYAAEGIQQHVERRRPVFAKQVLDRNASARVGFHNDCFMTNDSDYGTYSNYQSGEPSNFSSASAAKAWAQQTLTPSASFGGETCPLDPPGAERWRICDNMDGPDSEPGSLHMNYLNGDYANDAVTTWTSDGCYDEIRRKLGYRFEVTRVEYTPTVAAGQKFLVRVEVKNTGWAKLHKPRVAKLVLRNGSALPPYEFSGGAVDSWAPGQKTTISAGGTASPPGMYSVRLWIPDPDAETHIPYAVKLATKRGNVNMFDGTTGENDLGVSITVQ
jgi:hypothetical protein